MTRDCPAECPFQPRLTRDQGGFAAAAIPTSGEHPKTAQEGSQAALNAKAQISEPFTEAHMPDQKAWKQTRRRDMDEIENHSQQRRARAVCPTVQGVMDDLAARAEVGLAKYGTTVADNPLTHGQWLRHAYEEALDLAVYLRRATEDAQENWSRGVRAGWAEGEFNAFSRVLRAIDTYHAAETHERAAMALADLRRVVVNMREAPNAQAQD